jgi:hypothetical protein
MLNNLFNMFDNILNKKYLLSSRIIDEDDLHKSTEEDSIDIKTGIMSPRIYKFCLLLREQLLPQY